MATAILFHSVFGLRPVELGAAEMMRAAGHDVVTPDLYGGVTADTIENGFRLKDDIGWDRICARAKSALADLPSSTVLVGLSMGAGVVAFSLAPLVEDAGRFALVRPCGHIRRNKLEWPPRQFMWPNATLSCPTISDWPGKPRLRRRAWRPRFSSTLAPAISTRTKSRGL